MTAVLSSADGSSTLSCVSTLIVPASDRMNFWQETIASRILPLEFDRVGDQFFDASIKMLSLCDVQLASIHAPSHKAARGISQINRTSDDAMIFNFLVSGSCIATQDGKETILTAGAGACLNISRTFALTFHEEMRLLSLKVPYSTLRDTVSGLDRMVAYDFSRNSQIYPLVLAYISFLSNLFAPLDGLSAKRLNRNLIDLLGTLVAESIQHVPVPLSECRTAALIRIRFFIEQNLSNPELTPAMVAEALQLSPRYINHLLQAEGTSLGRLILRRRLEAIARDLTDPAQSPKSISSLASARGFNDMAHFSRSFRRHFGLSPRDHRHISSESKRRLAILPSLPD